MALLYVLELQYESERRSKGDRPALWHPSPRNRPSHFCYWTLDALATINGPRPRDVGALLRDLENHALPNVASMLAHTLSRRFGNGSGLSNLPVDRILDELGTPNRDGERHPQARKFARVVSEHLDSKWQESVAEVAREFAEVDGLPTMALLLGALPPSLDALSGRIFAALDDAELIHEHRMLTVLQFYGLVAGTLPPAPAVWQEVLDKLAGLTTDDVEVLAGLSREQVASVRRLGVDGWRLVLLRKRLGLSKARWSKLGERLRSGNGSTKIAGRAGTARIEAFMQKLRPDSPAHVDHLARSSAWVEAGSLQEELLRMIERGEVSLAVTERIENWSEATWSRIRNLLDGHHGWLSAYIEDCEVLEKLFATRSGARLNLRGLFPQTFSWLDQYLTGHLEDALVTDVGDLETLALMVSRRVRERMWTQPRGEELVPDVAQE